MTLRDKLEKSGDFVIGVELVSTRGTVTETRSARTLAFAEELASHDRVDWVSVTDNAGGNPQLAPAALARIVRASGRDVVVHLSCKDFNRNGVESEAWHLATEGLHNLLVLSGDYPGPGLAGGAKPVFDIDSVGLLVLLANLNAGLDITRPGARQKSRLGATEFFPACVVTNFKLHENEVVPQLLKLEKKLECGARWIVNQIGYDSRKIHELILWLQQRGWGHVPLIGNVYVLNPAVARLFRTQRIPGVVISDELAALCEEKEREPGRGRAWFIELAARQIAVYKGLGYRGAYLGGIHTRVELDEVLARVDAFPPDAWRDFAREIRFSRPGEFFLFPEDPATGLADAAGRPHFGAVPRSSRNVTYTYRFARFAHAAMFTPGRGLWNIGKKITASARDPRQGPALLRMVEKVSKSMLFDCRDCGDCSLPEITHLCPESSCAKNQRNGPCGGTRDGLCEVEDYECIWSRAYDRLAHEGRAHELLNHAPVIQNQSLRGTSSWANTWHGRDHLGNRLFVPPAAAPVPVTGRGEAAISSPPPTPPPASTESMAPPPS